jgi:transcriptional regulator with XRE-family HTH domain
MQRLTELRKVKKLSQKTLGRMIGVRQMTVSGWEAGLKIPDKKLSELAEVLKCRVEDLVEPKRAGKRPPPGKAITAVKQYREKANLKQRDLADKAGLSQSRLSRLEAGTTAPKPGEVERLAAVLGVPAVSFSAPLAKQGSKAPSRPAPLRTPDPEDARFVQLLAYYMSQATEKMTLESLAQKTGIPRLRISAMAAGTQRIDGEDLVALANVLNVLPDELRSREPGVYDPVELLPGEAGFAGLGIDLEDGDDQVMLAEQKAEDVWQTCKAAQLFTRTRRTERLIWEELDWQQLRQLTTPLQALSALRHDWQTDDPQKIRVLRNYLLGRIEDIEHSRQPGLELLWNALEQHATTPFARAA